MPTQNNDHVPSPESIQKWRAHYQSIQRRAGDQELRAWIAADRDVTERDFQILPAPKARLLAALDQIERELLKP